MRYVLSTHVENRFLKPPTTSDIAPQSIQELQQTLPSSESITNLKRLSKVAEFAKRVPAQRYSRVTTTASTAALAEAKEALYETHDRFVDSTLQREIITDEILKKYMRYGIGNWHFVLKKWWCDMCQCYLFHIRPRYIKEHYHIIHPKALTLVALRYFDD